MIERNNKVYIFTPSQKPFIKISYKQYQLIRQVLIYKSVSII